MYTPFIRRIALVVFASILTASSISALDPMPVHGVENMAGPRIVFVEDITATWCGYCPAASEGLKDLSNQRSDFRFITLVDDRVPDASGRIEEFNPTGFPTVMFDGGYDEKVGGVSSGDEYNENIDSCLERDLPDIDLTIDAYDMGGSEIRIDAVLQNNMDGRYEGNLRIMVVEVVSRYLDADGNNYPYSMLGYAADLEITSGPGEELTFSESWVGADNEDLLGDDFGDIDSSNIIVFASVFNSQSNYKKHPGLNANTFTAHYADAFAESTLSEMGSAPEVTILSPSDGDDVQGIVEITGEVRSEGGIDAVEVKIGQDIWRGMELQGSIYVYSWDSTDHSNGRTKISLRAYDDEGLSGIDNIEVDVQNEDSSTPPEITVLTHEPLVPEEGETVEVKLELYLFDTSVESAEIVVCVDGSCLPPEEMSRLDVDRFELLIGPYDAGQQVSYHAIVKDSEGNIIESTENLFTVQDAELIADDDTSDDDDDADDDDLDEQENTASNEGSNNTIYIGGAVALILVIVVIIVIFAMTRKNEKEVFAPKQDGGNDHYRSVQSPVQSQELELEEVHLK